jgi:acetylornithine deacetylase
VSETAQDLLGALVGFPTVAGTPNRAIIDFAAERLQAVGAQVSVVAGHRPDGFNLHAVIGPADQPGLVLSGHTDVVAVEGQAWSSDPFVLRVDDGRLYGRGSADMKGFLAAVLAVVGELDDGEPGLRALRRPLHVVLSSDEELGCRGIRPLLTGLSDRIAPGSLTIVGEPTRLRVVERHKGKLGLRVEVHGRAGHSARPHEGVNAVEYAARFVVATRELAEELRDEPPHVGFAVPHTTLSTGPIQGGTSLNIIPDRCVVQLEARLVPGADADHIEARLGAIAARLTEEMREVSEEAGISWSRMMDYPPLPGGGDPGLAAHVAALAGTEAGGAVDYGTEAGLLREALGDTVLVCGPGDMLQAHRPDEFIELDQLQRGQRLVAGLVALLSSATCRPD